VRDYAEVRADGRVTGAIARDALSLFEVDELGLDKVDRSVLHALCVTFAGQPVGLSTLAVTVGEQPETVEEVYEPFLLKAGMLLRTPRGRVASPGAFTHLGLVPPASAVVAGSLFAAETDGDDQVSAHPSDPVGT
jgi:Holliday junction DNA helicase RuvB